jgi:hypothetical protein
MHCGTYTCTYSRWEKKPTPMYALIFGLDIPKNGFCVFNFADCSLKHGLHSGRIDRHQNQWYRFSFGDWGALVHSFFFGKLKMKLLFYFNHQKVGEKIRKEPPDSYVQFQ